MTSPLVPLLVPRAAVTWSQARVSGITGNTVTLDWQGTTVSNVSRLTSYEPVVGDTVHLLTSESIGILVLGSSPVDTPVNPPEPPAPLTVNPVDSATYNFTTTAWVPGIVSQSLGTAGLFRYETTEFAGIDLNTLAGVSISLESSADSSSSVGMRLHTNDEFVGNLGLTETTMILGITPGVTQWVDLPLFWVSRLTSGDAQGIALVSPANTASSVAVTGGTLKINQL
jgi:hypothetical protein